MDFKKTYLTIYILAASLVIYTTGCKKFTEIDSPIDKIETRLVFNDEASANSAILGIYSTLNSGGLLTGNLSLYAGISADELKSYNPDDANIQLMNNNIATNNANTRALWSSAYSVIAASNASIDGLATSESLPALSKAQLSAEAKFLRAYCYFYLTNLFGDVPLLTSGNWQLYTTVARSNQSLIYQQVITDLKDAQNTLPASYATGNDRATKWAATALLARVMLYQKAWADAETNASTVISNSPLYNQPLPDLASVFIIDGPEAIWQVQPVSYLKNPQELVLVYAFGQLSYYVTDSLLNAFEAGDQRKSTWLAQADVSGQTYYYPFKYKSNAYTDPSPIEYHTPMRLAEQYLIRAEARANQNNISGAVEDLNVVRTRAGLPNLLTTLTQAQVMAAVEKENQVEFFAEWGHRWLDLKRWPALNGSGTRADEVLGIVKGANWQPTDKLYPIPVSDIQLNNNLTQNPGY